MLECSNREPLNVLNEAFGLVPALGIQKFKSRLWYMNIFQAYVKPLVLADSRDF